MLFYSSQKQIFLHHGTKTEIVPIMCRIPVWIFKWEIEEITNIPIEEQRIVCQGKEWRDEDVLTDEMDGCTVQVIPRGRGGDALGDMVNFFVMIGKILLALFEMSMQMFNAFVCGIMKLQDLWFCAFFYLGFIHLIICYMALYIMCVIMDLIFDTIGIPPMLLGLLQSMMGFLKGIGKIISRAVPKIGAVIDTISGCFEC